MRDIVVQVARVFVSISKDAQVGGARVGGRGCNVNESEDAAQRLSGFENVTSLVLHLTTAPRCAFCSDVSSLQTFLPAQWLRDLHKRRGTNIRSHTFPQRGSFIFLHWEAVVAVVTLLWYGQI